MKSPFKTIALLFFISFVIIGLFLPEFLFHPNDFLMAQGGDAFVIYYDMVYHVCHNSDYFQFYGMNYPFGESLIMTDAQAALSIGLKFIHEHLFSICSLVPGIVHSIILLLIPFTAIFLYFILLELGCKKEVSVLFCILITFLSPQLLRVTGHFGLAYPFLIPMVIYWFLIKYKEGVFRWRDIVYGSVLYFFFINNPYVGFSAGGLFLIAGVLVLILEKNKTGVLLVLIGLIPLLFGYISVKLSDPFDDRIIEQWGFFHYYASISGMIFPKGSLLYEILQPESLFGDVRFEGRINVGLVTTITLMLSCIYYFAVKIRKKPSSISLPLPFHYVFWASFIMFLYAANYSLYGFAREFMEKNMGPLLMFKASGRLAWPFYYGLTIMSALILSQLYQKYEGKKWSLILLIIIPSMIWSYEDFDFLKTRYHNITNENLFKNKEIKDQINVLGLNKEAYEGMYLLPVIQTWNDKFLFELDFHTQRAAMTISALTGIPMINGMMSRAPLETSISAIQMAAHPVIKRSRLKFLQNEKPYLIVYGNQKQKLTVGEKFMLDNADFIGEVLGARIYRIDKNDFQAVKIDANNISQKYFHNSWDQENSPAALTFPGAISTSSGSHILYKSDSLNTLFTEEDTLEISLWHYTDHRNYRVPKLQALADGKEYNFFNRSSYDYIGYWVRQSLSIPAPDHLVLTSISEYPVIYDDLHIQNIHDTTAINNDGMLIWNNYPLIEEDRFTIIK